MSDLMLLGVLRMPMDDPSPLEVAQYVARGRQAADEIERLTTERERDRARAREYHAAELADVVAEAAQLRQYLDTAQRRASALGDEVAGLREALESFTKSNYIRHQHPRRFAAAVAALEKAPTTPPPSLSPRS